MELSEKYETITNNGKYLGVRDYYNYFINLYLLNDKFYELWYFRPTNEIEKIEELTDLKSLNLYIDYMNQLDQTEKNKPTMAIPKNLDECVKQLSKIIDNKEKNEILKMNEDDFLTLGHFGLGMWIRNNWLYIDDSELTKYFKEKGISHPDNMSNEILKEFYKSIQDK